VRRRKRCQTKLKVNGDPTKLRKRSSASETAANASQSVMRTTYRKKPIATAPFTKNRRHPNGAQRVGVEKQTTRPRIFPDSKKNEEAGVASRDAGFFSIHRRPNSQRWQLRPLLTSALLAPSALFGTAFLLCSFLLGSCFAALSSTFFRRRLF
jgi:hypothetical protein